MINAYAPAAVGFGSSIGGALLKDTGLMRFGGLVGLAAIPYGMWQYGKYKDRRDTVINAAVNSANTYFNQNPIQSHNSLT